MKMIDKYGAMTVRGSGVGAYNGVMRDFFVTPGINVDGGNLVSNPQFDSGTTDWVASQSIISVSSNILTVTTGSYTVSAVYQATTLSVSIGKKIYYKARVRVINSTSCQSVRLWVRGTTGGSWTQVDIQINPELNQWYELSGIFTTPEDFTGDYRVFIHQYYVDIPTGTGTVMEIDGSGGYGVALFDLTSIYGAGNEPDLEYCDAFYNDFFTHAGTDYHGQIRIKPDCPIDSDMVNFRGKTTPWTSDDDITSGYDCGTINAYASGTAYAENDYVISAGTVYRSLLSSNTGNAPSSSPTYWIDVSDLDNNEWYVCMGTRLRNYFKAFPGKNGTYNDEFGQNESSAKAGGLIHEYTMDNISGATLIDSGGNDDGSTSNLTYILGKVGNSANFNGANSYVASLSTSLTGDYSVSFYIKVDTINSIFDAVFSNNTDTSPFCAVGYGVFAFGTRYNSFSSISASLDTWFHIVCIRDSSANIMRIYKDCVAGGIENNSANLSLTRLGTMITNGTNHYIDAQIDQLRLYNKILEPYEIQNLYNNGNGC